jgi:hypothetical protein
MVVSVTMSRLFIVPAVLLAISVGVTACFRPNYGDTPFLCTADTDFACPAGYACDRDADTGDPNTGVCTRGGVTPPQTDAGSDAAQVDAGGDGPAQHDAAQVDAGGQHDAGAQTDGGGCQGAAVVISQVYGGGGATGATYQNDFVELLNRSAAAVDVSSWSVQYAAAAGTSWSQTPLSGTIAPGGYLLVQEAATSSCSGSPCGSSLPTPEVTGTLMLAAASGKVALVSSQTTLTGTCPTTGVVDLVGYGTADCYEGAAAAPAISVTEAAVRGNGGCTHSSDNGADFTAAAPTPRNGSTAAHQCSGC